MIDSFAETDDEGNVTGLYCAGCGCLLVDPRNSNMTLQTLKGCARIVGGMSGWTLLCIVKPEMAVATTALNYFADTPQFYEQLDSAVDGDTEQIDLVYDEQGRPYCPKCMTFHLGTEYEDVYSDD